jgi:MFS family permease
MILSLIASVLGLLLCLIHSSTVAVIGVFLYGAGLDISYSCIFTLITEFFAENDRGFFYNIITLSFSAGIFLNALAFYYIDNWKIIVISFFILPIIVAILGFIFWVEDTPIELVAYKKPE